ncbi:MAG: cytochrome C oxidase subunit IV family protein [Halobacteriovoraceae bacterium]|nr:cytochrome C oxidase subunit IV family protein [Halobacteriovoraceae bacterium]
MSGEVVHKSHTKEYMIVFVLLAVLTVMELIVPELTLPYAVHGGLLTFLALVKAFLVAFFYMHLKEETRWLKYIALVPLSAFIYTFVVAIETMAR